MRATYTYEIILRAIGRELDHNGVSNVSLRETEDGIIAEGTTRDGVRQVLSFSLGDLVQMIDQTEGTGDIFATSPVTTGKLREFLAQHEAVLTR